MGIVRLNKMFFALVFASCLLSVSAHPFIVDGPSSFLNDVEPPEKTSPYDPQEEPWSEMTVIKTHYDYRGVPLWREVSRIKSRTGEPVKVEKSSREIIDSKRGSSSSSEAPAFFKSKSRLRIATPQPTVSTPASAPATSRPRPPPPMGSALVEVGPDGVIGTPIISCPEGYNEDYNGKCRPVFPEQY